MKERILNLNKNANTLDEQQLCLEYTNELLNLTMKSLQQALNEIREILSVSFEQFSVLCDIPVNDLKSFEECTEEIQLNECLVIASVLDYHSLEDSIFKTIFDAMFKRYMVDGVTLTSLNDSYTARFHNLVLKSNIVKHKRKKDIFIDDFIYVMVPKEYLTNSYFNYLCDHTIFDNDMFVNAIERLKGEVLSKNKKLIMPIRAFEKLEQCIMSNEPEVNSKAFIALNNIIKFIKIGIIEIKGNDKDPNLTETMIGVLKKFSSYDDTNLCVFTRSERLQKSLIKALSTFKNKSKICIFDVKKNALQEVIAFESSEFVDDTHNNYLYGYLAKWAELEGDKESINYDHHSNWDKL